MGSEDSFGLHHRDYEEPSYEITSRIMISAIIVLVLVVWLIFLLHVYARWIWTQPARFSRRRRRRRLASRRRGFHFTGQESERLRNVGLDSAILETLPMFLYKSQNFRDGLECAVCLCELEENEKARLLPNCGHSFHVDCIGMWFLSHSTCPLCRTGAQPELPGLESAVMDQVSGTISGPIGSGSHENLDTEQGQSASSGDLQNPRAILSCDRQKQMNAGMDEGTSRGRTIMSLTIEIPKRQDVFSSPGEAHQPCSPNGLKSPVARLRSLTRMLSRDTERIQVFPTNNPGECDAENNDQ